MTVTNSPTKLDPTSGVVLAMMGNATNTWEDAFDSYLLKHEDGSNNHTLTLVLRIHLNPLLPASARLPRTLRMPYADSDNTPLLIKPWGRSEWMQFKQAFLKECALWNNRFWLQPPAAFKNLDVKSAGRTVRPNMYCHLYISLVESAAVAHRSIVVVSLDKTFNPTFRSDSLHYSAADTQREDMGQRDDKGRPIMFSTVAHEIGHALGLPHSGVTHGDPLCKLSMIMGDNLTVAQQQLVLPAMFQDGSNSQVCYGTAGPPDRGRNVMGMGSVFDETNVSPWSERLAVHTGTKATDWKVSLKPVPPVGV